MRRDRSITYQDVAAYKEVTGIALTAWEVEALFRMDQAVNEFIAERVKDA